MPHIRKNLSTDSVCNSEEGNTYSTVPRSPGKVEQKMEGSEYEKVIGCNKEEVKRKGKHYWSVLRGGGIMGALCYPLVSFSLILYTQQIQNDTEQYITGHKCVFGLVSAQFTCIINTLMI